MYEGAIGRPLTQTLKPWSGRPPSVACFVPVVCLQVSAEANDEVLQVVHAIGDVGEVELEVGCAVCVGELCGDVGPLADDAMVDLGEHDGQQWQRMEIRVLAGADAFVDDGADADGPRAHLEGVLHEGSGVQKEPLRRDRRDGAGLAQRADGLGVVAEARVRERGAFATDKQSIKSCRVAASSPAAAAKTSVSRSSMVGLMHPSKFAWPPAKSTKPRD